MKDKSQAFLFTKLSAHPQRSCNVVNANQGFKFHNICLPTLVVLCF